MIEELAKLIPTVAKAILDTGQGGIIALLAVFVAGASWWENRSLRKRWDDMQEKRIDEVKVLVSLTERFTATMETALQALYRKAP